MYLYLFSLTISRDFSQNLPKKSFEVEECIIRVIVGEERCNFDSEVLIHVSENQFHIFTYCKIATRQSHLNLKSEILQEFSSLCGFSDMKCLYLASEEMPGMQSEFFLERSFFFECDWQWNCATIFWNAKKFCRETNFCWFIVLSFGFISHQFIATNYFYNFF